MIQESDYAHTNGRSYIVNPNQSEAQTPPPYELESEERLLGSLLIQPKFWGLAEALVPADFVGPNGRVFEALGHCMTVGLPMDAVNIANYLRDSHRLVEVGGLAAIIRLRDTVGVLIDRQITELVERVQRAAASRQAAAHIHRTLTTLYAEPQGVEEHLTKLRQALDTIQPMRKNAFDGEGLAQILAPQPEQPYIIPSLSIGPGYPTMFAGFSHSGKTMLLQDMMLDMAAGKFLFGAYHVKKPLRCLHLNYDQNAVNTRTRYAKLLRSKSYKADDLHSAFELCNRPPAYLNDIKAKLALRRKCERFDVCLIDSFLAALPGVDENASNIRRYLDELAEISEATGCTMMVIHHAGKSRGEEVEERQKPRGSSAIVDAVDGLFTVTSVPDTTDQCVVKQVKNKNEGTRVEFGITIETTQEHIRLVHMDMRQMQKADVMGAIKREILQHLTGLPNHRFSGNTLALAKKLKKRVEDVRAAVSMLESERKISLAKEAGLSYIRACF